MDIKRFKADHVTGEIYRINNVMPENIREKNGKVLYSSLNGNIELTNKPGTVNVNTMTGVVVDIGSNIAWVE